MSKNNLAVSYDSEFYEEAPHVRRACIPPDLTYETMSESGKELYRLSMDIAESGEGLLSEEEIEREIARRRGGYLREEEEAIESP
ncbi:MAG: hypothetical protein ACREAB_15750 [Blastocatellia bacterium]